MKLEDMDMAELPATLAVYVAKQEYLWNMYQPTVVFNDIPFGQDWWKYAYWVPKIKREFYTMAIKTPDFEKGLLDICEEYGIDYWYFTKHYKAFIKRLEWMRKNNNYNSLGETT